VLHNRNDIMCEKVHGDIEICQDERGKYVRMYCKTLDGISSFVFDFEHFDIVTKDSSGKKVNWILRREHRLKYRVGYYVKGRYNGKNLGVHQVIMKYWGHGHTKITVDHIDKDPLNNRIYNLRLATKSEQNSNTLKRERGCHATPLPEGIVTTDLPKYVSYTRYKRNTQLGYYDFFIIQCHPCQKKGEKWTTQMSMNITIKDKLKQAIEKIKEYDAIKTCDTNTNKIEKCVGINISGKQCNNNSEKDQTFCKTHNPNIKLLSVETCSANNKHGNRCKKEPLTGTLLCRYHTPKQ
jgi:hypothetical protein